MIKGFKLPAVTEQLQAKKRLFLLMATLLQRRVFRSRLPVLTELMSCLIWEITLQKELLAVNGFWIC